MWVIFSILAALCWTIVNIVDKYVLTKWVKQPFVVIIIFEFIGLLASIIVYFFRGLSPLSNFNIFLAILAGIFYLLMAIFYVKAVKIEEISRIVPLFYLSPLFILLFAGVFLGEIFTPLKYLGIFLLVIGALLISFKNLSKISFSKSFWLMILSTFSLSLNQLLTKYLLNFTDYWTIFSWERIGAAIGLIPLVYIYLPDLIDTVKEHGKRVVMAISVNETLNLFGVLFITIAVSVGYVTLANALSSIQPFFVLLFALILSRFYPSILKEEISKSTVFLKSIAVILMFVGAILII